MGVWNPCLHSVAEWWKQLAGESEGKDLQGIFPASVDLTTDLHSIGQWIQDGRKIAFETFVAVAGRRSGPRVPKRSPDREGLNYLAGTSVDMIN